MSLDGAKEEDKIFEEDGITFVIDEQLFEQVKPVNIDFITTNREAQGFPLPPVCLAVHAAEAAWVDKDNA